MTQIGSPFILLMFAARSGAIFIAVKYADEPLRAPGDVPRATRRGGDVDVAEQRLVPCIVRARALYLSRHPIHLRHDRVARFERRIDAAAGDARFVLTEDTLVKTIFADARAKLPLGVHGKHHVRHERVTGDVLEQTVKIPVVE